MHQQVCLKPTRIFKRINLQNKHSLNPPPPARLNSFYSPPLLSTRVSRFTGGTPETPFCRLRGPAGPAAPPRPAAPPHTHTPTPATRTPPHGRCPGGPHRLTLKRTGMAERGLPGRGHQHRRSPGEAAGPARPASPPRAPAQWPPGGGGKRGGPAGRSFPSRRCPSGAMLVGGGGLGIAATSSPHGVAPRGPCWRGAAAVLATGKGFSPWPVAGVRRHIAGAACLGKEDGEA